MAEKLSLTTPITAPTITEYVVDGLRIRWAAEEIVVTLLGPNGEERVERYSGDEALTRMRALNKANLTVKSLQRRVLEQLVTDGKLPGGSVSGSPD